MGYLSTVPPRSSYRGAGLVSACKVWSPPGAWSPARGAVALAAAAPSAYRAMPRLE